MLRSLIPACVLTAVFAWSTAAEATPPSGFATQATIKAVDAKAASITLAYTTPGGLEERTENVAADAKISIRGREATLAELKPGWLVDVVINTKGTRQVTQITISKSAPLLVEDGLKLFRSGKLEGGNLEITYDDAHPLHGGTKITVKGTGQVLKEVSRPGQKPTKTEYDIKPADVRTLVELLLEQKAWAQKVEERPALPDESKATLLIRTGEGSSKTWEWYNGMKKEDRLIKIRDAMEKLAQSAKKSDESR